MATHRSQKQTPGRRDGRFPVRLMVVLILLLIANPFAPLLSSEVASTHTSAGVAVPGNLTTSIDQDGHEEGIGSCHISAACTGWALAEPLAPFVALPSMNKRPRWLEALFVSLDRQPAIHPPNLLIHV